MPRMGKKTLYLDLEALDRLETALHRFPGRPSLSSFFNDLLPKMADQMEEMTAALERGGLRGMADLFGIVSREADTLEREVSATLQEVEDPDKKLSEIAKDVPPKKPRAPRAKKVAKE